MSQLLLLFKFYYLKKIKLLLFTLQYSIGFAIHQHASAMGVHVFPILNPPPPPSLYHPSGSSQCTSPKHPVSCFTPVLAIIYYMILYMSQCHSPKSCPLPSPTESKRLFYTSVSFLLSHIQGYHYHLFNSIHMRQYTVLVFFFLAYFTLYNRLQFIHLIRTDSNVFFLMAE